MVYERKKPVSERTLRKRKKLTGLDSPFDPFKPGSTLLMIKGKEERIRQGIEKMTGKTVIFTDPK